MYILETNRVKILLKKRINLLQIVYNQCRQKCPCCKRICGYQDLHEYHRCLYGHQIRALGGVKGKNGDASVIRCQDLEPHSEILFNGQQKTWMEFKQYWAKKDTDKWQFDDIDCKDSKRQLFDTAWEIIGPQYCSEKGIKYIESNYQNVRAQKKTRVSNQSVHFIFAIDGSTSMGGTKWKQTITALNQAIAKMRQIDTKNELFRVSLMTFSNYYKIQQQFIRPNSINTDLIHHGGPSTVHRPFIGALYLIKKWAYSVDKSYFIFISDGDTYYPHQQVSQINILKSSYQIEFAGIQIGERSRVMQQLSKDLNGTRTFNVSISNLGSAFVQIIDSENQQ